MNRDMALYIVMVIAGLIFVALPVIYFGQIDATSAIVLAAGIGLLIWAAVRMRTLRK
jgi:hypothetical protein